MSSEDVILKAFQMIGITPPDEDQNCIYKSGHVDSGDLMQLLLEIELETGKRLNLSALVEGDITLSRLRQILAGDK